VSFFNKKEEVLDIQLTQYGKTALATGQFQPHSYEFYDDDVIYNLEFIGVTEQQNDAQGRIFSSAKKKPARSIYGSETKVQETNHLGQQKDGKVQISPNSVDSDLLLRDRVSTYATATQELPLMTVSVLGNGHSIMSETITKTTSNYSNTSNDNIKIKTHITRNHNGTFHEPSPLVIMMEEHLEFCKDEEFEVKLYEIEKLTDKKGNLIDILSELYLEAPLSRSQDQGLAMLSNRFILLTDDEIASEQIKIEPREGCIEAPSGVVESEEESEEINFYRNVSIEPPDCEE